MRKRISQPVLLALVALIATAATAVAVASVTVYRNNMNTVADRADFRKIGSGRCDRGGSPVALRFELGRETRECVFRSPVVGRDIDISAVGRLLSGTPREKRGAMFIGLNVRDGQGGQYQFAVYPIRGEWKLRKDVPPDGTRETLAKGEAERIRGLNMANEIRLRVFNIRRTREKDDARIVVWINDKVFAAEDDHEAGPMRGRYASVAAGSLRFSRGATASFDDIVIRVPDPYTR